MKSTLFIVSMLLGGAIAVSCSPAHATERGFWASVVCYGAGTCGAPNLPPVNYVSPQSATTAPTLNPTLPTTVQIGTGSVLIVPNSSGGALPRAIIPVSR